jgi:hypothetical protein
MGIKADEITLLMLMQMRCRTQQQPDGETPRAIIAGSAHLINAKRAHFVLKKWVGKGWYDYGTVIDLGWFTPEGIAASYEPEWTEQQQ